MDRGKIFLKKEKIAVDITLCTMYIGYINILHNIILVDVTVGRRQAKLSKYKEELNHVKPN
ncbi:hypothetical protein AWM70_20745 [Paenibacillus yonginensis]|uniref:Uncharacterized protein n=1 Tax=Paenibacillus yonginensis TaxID=1462996 RepID=A0A1B1N5M6_9BACL|nr:hypothetical protein AWM70_20745 [Paenibacillus yonginensis]